MTKTQLARLVTRSHTVFNKAYELHKLCAVNFGDEHPITKAAFTTRQSAYKGLITPSNVLKTRR